MRTAHVSVAREGGYNHSTLWACTVIIYGCRQMLMSGLRRRYG